MKKTLTALLAALVLVAGAFITTTIAGGAATAQTTENVSTDQERPDFPKRGEMLDEVLADLVTDDVINQGQADKIAAVLKAKAEEVRAEMQQWREENPGSGRFGRGFKRGFHLGGLLEDGVIDSDEIAELPDDHPLKDPNGPAAKYLDDDQLTMDELQQLRQELHAQRQAERQAQSGGTGS
jgi:hypothetical protein